MIRRLAPFAWVVLAFAAPALQQIDLPGVYMDAVNPDYLSAKILNRHAEAIGAWLLPGNYLMNRYPVLIAFYHGSQQVWLGLPFFWLFGSSVTGLRLTHAVFALGVLFWMYAYLGRAGLKPWQAALACAALALDPGFSYAFRTQSYITVAPMGWLFLALWALARSAQQARRPAALWLVAGLSYGLAVFGYFIYSFFLPALVLALVAVPRPARRWAALCAGLALGGATYALGYALLVDSMGGVAGAWEYFQQTQRAINAFSEQPDFTTRVTHAAKMVGAVVTNWYHHALIFAEHQEVPGGGFKTALLVGAPLLLWLRTEWKRQVSAPLRLMVALGVSFFAVALGFGTRLSGHHFAVLLPIFYAALALGLGAIGPARHGWRSATAAVALPFAVLVALNVGGQVKEALRLQDLRGVGLYSDAINRFAADLDRMAGKPFAYLPDWGLSMPVAFLTRGRVGIDTVASYEDARQRLCAGRDVVVAVVTGERAERIAQWQREMRWDAPAVVPYRQADGKVVFDVATFAGRRDADGCPR